MRPYILIIAAIALIAVTSHNAAAQPAATQGQSANPGGGIIGDKTPIGGVKRDTTPPVTSSGG